MRVPIFGAMSLVAGVSAIMLTGPTGLAQQPSQPAPQEGRAPSNRRHRESVGLRSAQCQE